MKVSGRARLFIIDKYRVALRRIQELRRMKKGCSGSRSIRDSIRIGLLARLF